MPKDNSSVCIREGTVKLKDFGTVFVTRYDARTVVQSLGAKSELPKLDFPA
jgi:hypothetical protein